jgi:hypothetical protein
MSSDQNGADAAFLAAYERVADLLRTQREAAIARSVEALLASTAQLEEQLPELLRLRDVSAMCLSRGGQASSPGRLRSIQARVRVEAECNQSVLGDMLGYLALTGRVYSRDEDACYDARGRRWDGPATGTQVDGRA